jgi:hypothetical protein
MAPREERAPILKMELMRRAMRIFHSPRPRSTLSGIRGLDCQNVNKWSNSMALSCGNPQGKGLALE